jgi:hypothetical protein
MSQQENKTLRFFKIYSIFLTIAVTVLIILSFRNNPTRFKEIDVERINVLEADGTQRLVISNKQRQDPGTIDGKKIPPREREAGMIFFNNQGDECGGITYSGNRRQADASFTFDQCRNDQIIQLQYTEDSVGNHQTRSYGLKMYDRDENAPLGYIMSQVDSLKNLHDTAIYNAAIQKMVSEGLLGTGRDRLFVGKTYDKEVGLFIKDKNGKPRIKLYVNQQNEPKIEFLDENGNPVPVK